MNCSLKPSIESVRLGNFVDCALIISTSVRLVIRLHHPADASSANTFGHSILFSTSYRDIVSVFRAFYSSSMHNHLNDSFHCSSTIVLYVEFDEINKFFDLIKDKILHVPQPHSRLINFIPATLALSLNYYTTNSFLLLKMRKEI